VSVVDKPNFIIWSDTGGSSYYFTSSFTFNKVSDNIYDIARSDGGTIAVLPSWISAKNATLTAYKNPLFIAEGEVISRTTTQLRVILQCKANGEWDDVFDCSSAVFDSKTSHASICARSFATASGAKITNAHYIMPRGLKYGYSPPTMIPSYPYTPYGVSSCSFSGFSASFMVSSYSTMPLRTHNRAADYYQDNAELTWVTSHYDNSDVRLINGSYSVGLDTMVTVGAGNAYYANRYSKGPQLEFYAWVHGNMVVYNNGNSFYTASQISGTLYKYNAYLLTSSGCQGEFAGRENHVAVCMGTSPVAWKFIPGGGVQDGVHTCWDYQASKYYYYNSVLSRWQTTAPTGYWAPGVAESYSAPAVAGYLYRLMQVKPEWNIYDARQALRKYARHHISRHYDTNTVGFIEDGGFGYVDYITFLEATASTDIGISPPDLQQVQEGPNRVDFYWRNCRQTTFSSTVIAEFSPTYTLTRQTPPESGSIIYNGTGSYYHHCYTSTGSVVYGFYSKDNNGHYSALENNNYIVNGSHQCYYCRWPFVKKWHDFIGCIKTKMPNGYNLFPLVAQNDIVNNSFRMFTNGDTYSLMTGADHEVENLSEPYNWKIYRNYYDQRKLNIKSFDDSQMEE